MTDTPGTSRLTVEQQQWFHERFGVVYHQVQDNLSVPNRKARRAWNRSKRSR